MSSLERIHIPSSIHRQSEDNSLFEYLQSVELIDAYYATELNLNNKFTQVSSKPLDKHNPRPVSNHGRAWGLYFNHGCPGATILSILSKCKWQKNDEIYDNKWAELIMYL